MAKEKPSPTDITENEAPRYVVTITAPVARRRAGFAFGPTPVHLTSADLDEEKVAALKADPLLSIRPYEPEEADKE